MNGAAVQGRAIALGAFLVASCRCASGGPPAQDRGSVHRQGSASPPASGAAQVASRPPFDSAVDAAPAGPAPLHADSELVSLDVAGFRSAVVSLPLGARERRPVVVALHGNYDRPEWQCEIWRGITREFAFVLCPRGIPRDDAPKGEDRWHYGGLKATKAELDAGLVALEAAYPDHVDAGPVLLTGFSLGAILGAHFIRSDPGRFPRVVLTEGGADGWAPGFAKKMAEAGAVRVLFACGQTACKQQARGPVRTFEKAGIGARVAYGGNVGHTYDGPVAASIAADWAWLTEGDPRWAGQTGPSEPNL